MTQFEEINTRAEYFTEYFSFDDNFPFAVQILDENESEIEIKVFPTKEEALIFEKEYNIWFENFIFFSQFLCYKK